MMTKHYRTLVVDPPWPIKKSSRTVRPNQVSMDYPLMTVPEIAALPVKQMADCAGAHVYLWTTHRHLPDAFDIFKKWDVRYHCLLTWVKNVGFTPFSWMFSTEHVLFGRTNTLPLMKLGKRVDFYARGREHSRKPAEFYSIVREVSPGPRLDMFAREQHEGFDQWGDEVNRFPPPSPMFSSSYPSPPVSSSSTPFAIFAPSSSFAVRDDRWPPAYLTQVETSNSYSGPLSMPMLPPDPPTDPPTDPPPDDP
jgi:N6-adenosine-specific RNA methylase IME4